MGAPRGGPEASRSRRRGDPKRGNGTVEGSGEASRGRPPGHPNQGSLTVEGSPEASRRRLPGPPNRGRLTVESARKRAKVAGIGAVSPWKRPEVASWDPEIGAVSP